MLFALTASLIDSHCDAHEIINEGKEGKMSSAVDSFQKTRNSTSNDVVAASALFSSFPSKHHLAVRGVEQYIVRHSKSHIQSAACSLLSIP
jgi:hypothetical protein